MRCLTWAAATLFMVASVMPLALGQGQGAAEKAYVQNAALVDLLEIEASKLALQKTANPAVKNFALKMVEDHGASNRKLKDFLTQHQLEAQVPTSLDKDSEHKLDELRAAESAEFDRQYLDMQLKGHESALTLHRTYSETGQNEAMRKLAAEIAVVVERHLAELKQIKASGAS